MYAVLVYLYGSFRKEGTSQAVEKTEAVSVKESVE